MVIEEKRILVCAPGMPELDREGGSRRIFHFLEFFQRAGWSVSFAAMNAERGERYAHVLQQMGIPVYAFQRSFTKDPNALTNPAELFSGGFDIILFAFWFCGEPYIRLARGLSPTSKVVVDSIDVHFLRQARKVFCATESNGAPPAVDSTYAHEMRRELNVYAGADVVWTVSDKEAGFINDLMGKPLARSIPDREDVEVSTIPFADRKGILFIGNFRHPPNVQAVEYLCDQVLPKVSPQILEEHPVYIVGNDPNAAVVRACRGMKGVRLVGWVPSVLPYLKAVRLSVVPLLYGAGTKRKLMQSLMAGTPAVSTSIGIEGFDLQPGHHVLVADSAAAFAGAISTLATSEELWQRLSQEGRAFVISNHGGDAVFRKFSRALAELIDPLSSVPVFWEELRPAAPSEFDEDRNSVAIEQALRRGKLEGVCNVSGRRTDFVASSDNLRESLIATASSSSNRQRQLICSLSMALFGHPRSTLAKIAAHINENELKVYVAEANSVLSDFLSRKLKSGLLVTSEYFGPEHRSGDVVKGILHQDLQCTSFGNEEFDIIITTEVLEHVPDAVKAERELMRILKPGGVYCFTVPFLPVSDHDLVLADLDEQGKIRYFAEPQFHSDPLRPEGVLVYRLFSFNDLKQRFETMGHQFKSYRFWSESVGIVGSDCWAHVVTKPAAAMNAALTS